jgi:hypothetical protein
VTSRSPSRDGDDRRTALALDDADFRPPGLETAWASDPSWLRVLTIDGHISTGVYIGAGTSVAAITGGLLIARWRVLAIVVGVLWVGAIGLGLATTALGI